MDINIKQHSWKDHLYYRETNHIKEFFGKELPFTKVPDYITEEQVRFWENNRMGLHFLPNVDLLRTSCFPGYKVKLYEWFFERVDAEDILDNDDFGRLTPVKNSTNLGGHWILIDERPKPEDKNGMTYENDFLADHIMRLREQGELETNSNLDPGTRFYVSWTEWYEKLRPIVANFLGVGLEQVRLPRAIEFNYIGNLLHPDWGTTETWEWLQEACNGGKYRLRGGHAFAGGLAVVYWRTPTGHGTDRGFRPFVDFH